MIDDLPFSQACENNKAYILKVLSDEFESAKKVLEIGSGTGQHAIYFSQHLPHLIWQTSDQTDYHPGIELWRAHQPQKNCLPPLALKFPLEREIEFLYDGVFSANTAHIMHDFEVQAMLEWISESLPSGAAFCQYGPFTFDGKFTSPSNEDFHHKLINTGRGGYKDIAQLDNWTPGLTLQKCIDMPANNHMLVWRKD